MMSNVQYSISIVQCPMPNFVKSCPFLYNVESWQFMFIHFQYPIISIHVQCPMIANVKFCSTNNHDQFSIILDVLCPIKSDVQSRPISNQVLQTIMFNVHSFLMSIHVHLCSMSNNVRVPIMSFMSNVQSHPVSHYVHL